MAQDKPAVEAKSALDKILKTLTSDDFSNSTNTLIGIWNDQGKSPEEIKQLLDEFQKRESARVAQLKDLKGKLDQIMAWVAGRDDLINQSKVVEAKLDLEIATLKGRLAERQAATANLEKSISDHQAKIAARQKMIDDLERQIADMGKA
jgi:peptidoglycan hydrolase CwlO-like protein